jgi:hypothetical protein
VAALLFARDPERARAMAARAAAKTAGLPPKHPVRAGCTVLAERLAVRE